MKQVSSCGWINAGQKSINLNGYQFGTDGSVYPYAGFHVTVWVTWRLSNNALIGQRAYDYNSTSDYSCSYKCSTGMSTVGEFVMFDF